MTSFCSFRFNNKMPFSVEDRHVIKCLRQNKNYSAKRLLKEFPRKGWTLGGLNDLIRKIDTSGTIARKAGSGRPRTVRTIVKRDLGLRCFKKYRSQELTAANKLARLQRCRRILRLYPSHAVEFIWFTDEKLFTMAAPSNSQNDRLYAAAGTRKRNIEASRLLRTRPTFSRSLMVSVGVSALGCTAIHFVEPGTKINGRYYRTCCYHRSCSQTSASSLTSTCFNRTVLLLTELGRQLSFSHVKLLPLSHQLSGHITALTSIL